MCVCIIYAYKHIHVYICAYICMHVCVYCVLGALCVYVYVCTYACVYVCMYIYWGRQILKERHYGIFCGRVSVDTAFSNW